VSALALGVRVGPVGPRTNRLDIPDGWIRWVFTLCAGRSFAVDSVFIGMHIPLSLPGVASSADGRCKFRGRVAPAFAQSLVYSGCCTLLLVAAEGLGQMLLVARGSIVA
jgi:hypothetical protein